MVKNLLKPLSFYLKANHNHTHNNSNHNGSEKKVHVGKRLSATRLMKKQHQYYQALEDDGVDDATVATLEGSSGSACSLTAKPAKNQLLKQDEPSLSCSIKTLVFSIFEEDFQQACDDPSPNPQLELKNFVERSDHHDIVRLKEVMLMRKWNCILLVDTFHAKNYRRWQFKKNGLCRMLLPIIMRHRIPVRFDSKLEIDVDEMKQEAIVFLLGEVGKDPEITSLHLEGEVEHHADIGPIVSTLIALLRLNDRKWQEIIFRVTCQPDCRLCYSTGFGSTNHRDDHDNVVHDQKTEVENPEGEQLATTSSSQDQEETTSNADDDMDENKTPQVAENHLKGEHATTTIMEQPNQAQQVVEKKHRDAEDATMERCVKALKEVATKLNISLRTTTSCC